jgi:hypothetical protein
MWVIVSKRVVQTMAFSFDNIINKIKQQFKPKTYINTDTGEVIKKRIYKQLSEEEKQVYISAPKFDEVSQRIPTPTNQIKSPTKHNVSFNNQTQDYTASTNTPRLASNQDYYDKQEREQERQERKIRKAELTQREREERRRKRKEILEKNRIEREQREFDKRNKSKWERENKRWKERKEKESIKQEEREAKKRQRAIDKADRERKKKYEKAVEKWEKKQKTYEDVKPPAPPKNITKELETKLKEEPVAIYSIDKLKQELNALERKNFPMIDLSGTRSFLLGIVEDMENYYEDTDTYVNYLMENEEDIAELIQVIEYDSQQEEVEIAITNLATLLNMGILSDFQQDDLDYVQNTYGWSNE